MNKNLTMTVIATLLITACKASDDPADSSKDVATASISAEYTALQTTKRLVMAAEFKQGDKPLTLANTDTVTASAHGKDFTFKKLGSKSQPVYNAQEDTDDDTSSVTFTLTRSALSSEHISAVNMPSGFDISAPSGDSTISPNDGKVLLVWSNNGFLSNRLVINYAYRCSLGSSTVASTAREVTADDGNHEIDLATIFQGQNFNRCDDFDIAIQRERRGTLSSDFRSGSITGVQLRTVTNIRLTNIR
ncbi:Uncharacterised protein [BD1-7 clade bacterium]|uniref:Lipoprotein n=1 Tax=BD1-7 clade bacterium TaxID=2029982 RepID=A0A5S9NV43_9GAMM|nr:Uncharacterised protein [BD1-7 clade bacterium]CAA0109836.1 Uncharacterised protein [BD1-7 clade bacterium]